MILFPVLCRTPRDLRGRAGVAAARRLGRVALEESARAARRPASATEPFPRDEARAPLPSRAGGRTWYWSTTNTHGLAAAVVAPARVGIDAEWLDRPRIENALDYVDTEEREQLGLDERRGLLALWCAKEAVLKATSIGMAGMGRLRLERVLAADRLLLTLDGEAHETALLWEGEHVLALACEHPGFRVEPLVREGLPA